MLRARRVAAGVALGAAALLCLPSPALASPSAGGDVRSWSVWQSDGTAWLATTAGYGPQDGSVLGWRFSAAPDVSASEPPGGELPSFQDVCGQDTAGSGHKRVALVVDFGEEDDARPGDRPPAQDVLRCVAGAEDATAVQFLASAAEVRVNALGEVASVAGYPAAATGAEPAPAPARGPSGGPPVLLIAGGAGALLLLGGGAVIATRRRATRPPARSAR